MSPNRTKTSPSECPVCGEPVPPGARACPHCGADERTGWNDEATRYDGLDLPDAAFEDDAQSPPVRGPRRATPRYLWAVVAVLVAIAFGWLMLR